MPFGIEWLTVERLRIELGLGIKPTGPTIDLGLLVDIELGGIDLFAAIKIGGDVVPAPRGLRPRFEGIRAWPAAPASTSRTSSPSSTDWRASPPTWPASPKPAELELPDDFPNIALRNLQFSFAVQDIDTLCMKAGLIISADLYIDPSGDEPTQNPGCENTDDRRAGPRGPVHGTPGRRLRRPASASASARAASWASSRSPASTSARSSLHGLVLDLAVTAGDQHLKFKGGASISADPGRHRDPRRRRRARDAAGLLRAHRLGEVAGTFDAYVHAAGNINPLQGPRRLRPRGPAGGRTSATPSPR